MIQALLGFLLGRHHAIIRVARSPHALPIGALLVLSAALAREYDGADLRAEPWHLMLPFVASSAAALLLYLALSCGAHAKGARTFAASGYVSFLGLFWATAPLAWLYAVPWERWLSPLDAVRANLITLAVVSVWRVALMVRVIAVLTRCGAASAILLTLTVASLVVFAVSWTVPIPLGVLMAGIRVPLEELLPGVVALNSLFVSACAFPILLIATVVAVRIATRPWTLRLGYKRRTRRSGPALHGHLLAALSVLIWLPLLVFTQPPQHLRSQVERAVNEQRYDDAAHTLARHARGDFPPHWMPPPRASSLYDFVPVITMIDACLDRAAPHWVLEHYRDTLLRMIEMHSSLFDFLLRESQPDSLRTLTAIARREPRILAALQRHIDVLKSTLNGQSQSQPAWHVALEELVVLLDGAVTGD